MTEIFIYRRQVYKFTCWHHKNKDTTTTTKNYKKFDAEHFVNDNKTEAGMKIQ